MAITKFSQKDPEETVIVTFDFSNLFVDAGEKIMSVDWHVHVDVGIDNSPTNILDGLPSFNNTTTSHLITAGVEGCIYHISPIVTTNKDQILKLTGSMEIKAQG